MNRNQAKEFYPILQAYAEERVIECRTKPSALSKSWQDMNEWTEMKEIEFWNNIEYRIKQQSEAKFRPFNTEEECWQEMLKHNEFGWVKSKTRDANKHISNIEKDIEGNVWFVAASFSGIEKYSPKQMLDYFVFMDGEPFGIKEE